MKYIEKFTALLLVATVFSASTNAQLNVSVAFSFLAGSTASAVSAQYPLVKGVYNSTAGYPGKRSKHLYAHYAGLLYVFLGSPSYSNDVWAFDTDLKQWAWLAGDSTTSSATFGTKQLPDSSNTPGYRYYSSGAVHNERGEFVFYGGSTPAKSDMWTYNLTSNVWTWISGASVGTEVASFGSVGATPGARFAFASVVYDPTGEYLLFGGFATGTTARNDMWAFNFTSLSWTWISGSSGTTANPVFGPKGQWSTTYIPYRRGYSSLSVDTSSNILYLHAGQYNGIYLADTWAFNRTSLAWKWAAGLSVLSPPYGKYGTKGSGSPSNYPGCRSQAAFKYHSLTGLFVLYGGTGYSTTTVGYLNDLWTFDPASTVWTWVSGSSGRNTAAIFSVGYENPPSQIATSMFINETTGAIYLHGGEGYLTTSVIENDNLWVAYLNVTWASSVATSTIESTTTTTTTSAQEISTTEIELITTSTDAAITSLRDIASTTATSASTTNSQADQTTTIDIISITDTASSSTASINAELISTAVESLAATTPVSSAIENFGTTTESKSSKSDFKSESLTTTAFEHTTSFADFVPTSSTNSIQETSSLVSTTACGSLAISTTLTIDIDYLTSSTDTDTIRLSTTSIQTPLASFAILKFSTYDVETTKLSTLNADSISHTSTSLFLTSTLPISPTPSTLSTTGVADIYTTILSIATITSTSRYVHASPLPVSASLSSNPIDVTTSLFVTTPLTTHTTTILKSPSQWTGATSADLSTTSTTSVYNSELTSSLSQLIVPFTISRPETNITTRLETANNFTAIAMVLSTNGSSSTLDLSTKLANVTRTAIKSHPSSAKSTNSARASTFSRLTVSKITKANGRIGSTSESTNASRAVGMTVSLVVLLPLMVMGAVYYMYMRGFMRSQPLNGKLDGALTVAVENPEETKVVVPESTIPDETKIMNAEPTFNDMTTKIKREASLTEIEGTDAKEKEHDD